MSRTGKYARILCPFPTIEKDGRLSNGTRLGQCKTCRTCKAKDCRLFVTNSTTELVEHRVCPFGLSVFIFRFDDELLLANGLYAPGLNSACPKRVRKALRNHAISIE